MNIWVMLAILPLLSELVASEYPGRRKFPINPPTADERQYLIEQLSNYIDQQARKKFQQHIHSQQRQHDSMPQEISGPGFSFQIPPTENGDFINESDEPIQFAVQPFDSRFYESYRQDFDVDDAIDPEKTVEIENPVAPAMDESQIKAAINEIKNKILIPSPMHVHDTASSESQSRILHRAQQKLQQQQLLNKQPSDVLQKPLQVEFDNTTSLYIVALIAGLSCAFSTGLIALGLMYWTLKKKVKSADACDYASCDYGVVGPRMKNPNSEVALGDKKLAHSAQMFHYQHQKNQIIAMENRNGTEMGHNDEDNDSDENENDFTVYECPGLAEWSEGMEVKNPLFSEETPATKNEKVQPTTKTTGQK